jgi:putative heme-binding domain-containing protein
MRALAAGILCSLPVCAQASPPPPAQPAELPLFDGTTLAGWRGDAAVWRVENGAIVGSSAGAPVNANTFLVLQGREPADFELVVHVELSGDNNSGVQYRSRVLPGDGFRVAGYQCDVHREPRYAGMLYDEQGAGIVAENGQAVLWRDGAAGGARRVLAPIHRPVPVDWQRPHALRIVAMGDVVWHELDGAVVAVVVDERAAAPRRGVLALQVHAGAPMTVRFRQPVLREWPDAEAMRRDVAVPAIVGALRASAAAAPVAAAGTPPAWVWDSSPQDGEEVFLRRTFAVGPDARDARLVVSCDNHCRVFVNGAKVGSSDEWEAPLRLDVTSALRAGDNVLAVHAWNDGGVAALAARLSWRDRDGAHDVVTDGAWVCSSDDPDGWDAAAAAPAGFAPVRVLGAAGDARLPWTRAVGADAFADAADPFAPQVALVATNVDAVDPKEPLGDGALKLLDVPRSLGSWVSLANDPKGRLYASAERGGLYRVVPAAGIGALSTIERVPVDMGERGGAHGLLWFRDALYAVVNGKASGLYRLKDTNGDDALDRVELLQALDGDGEHGPHSVVVAPDGEHLLVVAGNQTKLPELASSRVPTNWKEDRLLPRLDDPNPYWEGISPPGGWVCQCDADGKDWELICCGFRNPYDLAVLPNGQVVTFDSDMEWDMGLPWYRPTRLLAVHSGVDYGWRIGSAKWPSDYPDAPPALRNIGPSSPTGMAVVPELGLLALDWTFGTVYRDGVAWVVGAPLPLTDVTVAPRATATGGGQGIYLVTGGRGLPSSLHRVDVPPLGAATAGVAAAAQDRSPWGKPIPWPATESRSPREILQAAGASAFRAAAELDGVALRQNLPWHAARIALSRAPVDQWRATALADSGPMVGLLALARHGTRDDLQPILDALGRTPFLSLSGPENRVAWLRVHALALLRLGPPTDAQRAAIAERLLPLFPTFGNERQDQDLAELLAYVDAPGFLDKAVPLLAPLRPSPVPQWAKAGQQGDVYGARYAGVIAAMARAMPPVGQIAIADALRTVKHGWTLDQRRAFFAFVEQARTRKGGSSYDGYLKKIADAAWATCTPDEQRELEGAYARATAERPRVAAPPPKGPGRDWQLGDAEQLLRGGLANADVARGRELFHAASCASCHSFAGEGGNHGPDLTSLGNKFTARDVLEAILEPGKVVSEQYAGQVLTRHDGTALFGFAVKAHHGDAEVWEVMPAAADAQVVRVPVADVAKVERSPLSPMPPDLIDRLSAEEVRALLAFLLSRGVSPAGR